METIMQYIPLAVSAILLAALILTVITNIITQVVKKITWDKIPTNILAVVVAMAVTLVAFLRCSRSWGGPSPGTWWLERWPWACSWPMRLCSDSTNCGRPWSRSRTGTKTKRSKRNPRHLCGAGGLLIFRFSYREKRRKDPE